jgi:hypothetical protein
MGPLAMAAGADNAPTVIVTSKVLIEAMCERGLATDSTGRFSHLAYILGIRLLR